LDRPTELFCLPISHNKKDQANHQEQHDLAIPAAAAAIAVNPKSAATSAIIRKIKAQRSILSPPSESNRTSQSLRVFFCLTNPTTRRDSLFLHYEYNLVNHSHSSVDWSVTYVAV
jgi:hypothetical protein